MESNAADLAGIRSRGRRAPGIGPFHGGLRAAACRTPDRVHLLLPGLVTGRHDHRLAFSPSGAKGNTVPERPDLNDRDTWVRLLQHHATAEEATPSTHPPQHGFDADDPGVEAWRIAGSAADPDRFLGIAGLNASAGGDGPMLSPRDDLAIEVWTECELSVLHAGWRIILAGHGDREPRRALLARLRAAVAWHLEHTQPDNATSRPWGIHAFLDLGRPDVEAIDYAANMLHAAESARTSGGGNDRLRGWILDDAARGLREVATPRIGGVESIELGIEDGGR